MSDTLPDLLARLRSEPEWRTEAWIDSNGNPTDTWDIYCGETRIVSDLCKSECDDIVEAHNLTTVARLLAAVQALEEASIPTDNPKWQWELITRKLASALDASKPKV